MIASSRTSIASSTFSAASASSVSVTCVLAGKSMPQRPSSPRESPDCAAILSDQTGGV